MVVAPEAGLYHPREVTALFPGLVDADAHRFQAREVQKQIIDKIAELSVIMPADDGAERNTILPAERMVGNEGVELSVSLVREVLQPFHLQRHVKIAHTLRKPCFSQLTAKRGTNFALPPILSFRIFSISIVFSIPPCIFPNFS